MKRFRMYDIDNNGFIDPTEMTKIVKAIHGMLGKNKVSYSSFQSILPFLKRWSPFSFKSSEIGFGSPEAHAEEIFRRMDTNSDSKVTQEEFIKSCLSDPVESVCIFKTQVSFDIFFRFQNLVNLLTPHLKWRFYYIIIYFNEKMSHV